MPDPLDSLLREWELKPTPATEFRAAVWRRIAEQERRLMFRVRNRVVAVTGRPIWAAIIVATTLIAGVVAGNAWREHAVRSEQATGRAAYILAVNPVARAAPHPQ